MSDFFEGRDENSRINNTSVAVFRQVKGESDIMNLYTESQCYNVFRMAENVQNGCSQDTNCVKSPEEVGGI